MNISRLSPTKIMSYIQDIDKRTGFDALIRNNKLKYHSQKNSTKNVFQLYNFFVVSTNRLNLSTKWTEKHLLTLLVNPESPSIIERYTREIAELFDIDSISNDVIQLPSLLRNLILVKEKLENKFDILHPYYEKRRHILSFYPDSTEIALWFHLPTEEMNEIVSLTDDQGQLFISTIRYDTNVESLWTYKELDKHTNNWAIRSVFNESTNIGANRKDFLEKFLYMFDSRQEEVVVPILNNISAALGTTVDDILINSKINKLKLHMHSAPFNIHYGVSDSGYFTYKISMQEIIVDKDPKIFKQKLSEALVSELSLSFKSSFNI